MGIKHWWHHGLGLLLSKSECRDLSDFHGKRIAVDLSIWLNQFLLTDVDKLASTCEPVERCPDLLKYVQKRHEDLVAEGIIPVYVYDGPAPDVKNETKAKRKKGLQTAGKEWLSLLARGIADTTAEFTAQELSDASKARMKMKKPTYLDQAGILAWMKSEDIEVYGSLFEADQQMVKLEKDGVVDGIFSEDGDIVALGGRLVLAKLSRKASGKFQVKVFDRNEFMRCDNPYNSKLSKYPALMTHCALLLGNDYHHIEGNGEATVLGKRDKSYSTTGARQDDGMLDKLNEAGDKMKWVENFGVQGKRPLEVEVFNRYVDSYMYMLHAPTLRINGDGSATIEPLNRLPEEHSSWEDYFRTDFDLGELSQDKITAIYKCDVLPLTRQPLAAYEKELSRPCLFQELDFGCHPICVQPPLCLVNWLRARGIEAKTEHPRSELEELARKCIDQDKPVQANVLKPIVGVHDGFEKIKLRLVENERDSPSPKYVEILKSMERISNEVIDRNLGAEREGRPSIRRRVAKLIKSGNYNPKSIRCRNVACRETGVPCILFTVECLSSKTSVIHTVYAVFEDREGGKFMRDLSSCSCKKGSLFCSHCIGFLYVVAIIQNTVPSEEEFESTYRASPQVLAAVPMMIENVCAADRFNSSSSQRKRQRMSRDSADGSDTNIDL